MRKAKTGVIRATVLSRVASYEEEGDDYSGLASARPTSRQIAVAWAEWVLDGTDREDLISSMNDLSQGILAKCIGMREE